MMIIWWSKHVGVILSVLVCGIWINVLLQTSALVGPLYIVNWNARWNSEKHIVRLFFHPFRGTCKNAGPKVKKLYENQLTFVKASECRSQRPRGVRRMTAAARLLRLWVRIPPGTRISVCCECCVFSGRGLCDELITRPEESYRLWCVVECDLDTSWLRRPRPTGGCCAIRKK
jgi:hypothetical protein